MSFDTKFCVAYILNEKTFNYFGFDWTIEEDATDNQIILTSEYWDKGIPHSFLFQPMNAASSDMKLREGFDKFRKLELIEGDIQYKILSTLCMNYKYKLFLYTLVKLPRIVLNKELRRLRNRGDEIYDKLEKYIRLYEGSPLLFEEERQRIEKFKMKQNRKANRYKRPRTNVKTL